MTETETKRLERVCREVRVAALPIRVVVLRRLVEHGASPSSLAERFGMPVNGMSYHVGQLREAGLIRLTHVEPRRGTLEHYYRATPRGAAVLDAISALNT